MVAVVVVAAETEVHGDFFGGEIEFDLVCKKGAFISKGAIEIQHDFFFPVGAGKPYLQFVVRSSDVEVDFGDEDSIFYPRDYLVFCLRDGGPIISLSEKDYQMAKEIYKKAWRAKNKARTYKDALTALSKPTANERMYYSLARLFYELKATYFDVGTFLFQPKARLDE